MLTVCTQAAEKKVPVWMGFNKNVSPYVLLTPPTPPPHYRHTTATCYRHTTTWLTTATLPPPRTAASPVVLVFTVACVLRCGAEPTCPCGKHSNKLFGVLISGRRVHTCMDVSMHRYVSEARTFYASAGPEASPQPRHQA